MIKPLTKSLSIIAPGVLIAATGVGAGDLLTAAMAGSEIGLTILWAAVVGAAIKWTLNEGIARWQMATGTTLLEGWIQHLGSWIQWVFLGYLALWTFFTGGALINACGLAAHSLIPLPMPEAYSKAVWGATHAWMGYGLIRLGGFALFERMMGICIAIMFVTVLTTAALLLNQTDNQWSDIQPVWPTANHVPWLLGVLGGVGGTVTLLCYGYWIREKGRQGISGLKISRLDLAVGYTLTGLFGMAMILIGSNMEVQRGEGGLANVAVAMAHQVAGIVGSAGRWVFLIGFWGAVFSSLLGVWQGAPYLFADFMLIRQGKSLSERTESLSNSKYYRWHLLAITWAPLPLLVLSVKQAQLAYALLGSLFIPLLAITLIMLNRRLDLVGKRFQSGWIINGTLIATLALFFWIAYRKL